VPENSDDGGVSRDHILDAAVQVFAEKGYHAARMDDVVATSGLSKGAVYWHFKSKDGLLTAVLRRLLSGELGKLKRVPLENGSVADGLLAFVRQLTDGLERIAVLRPLMLDFYAMAARRDWVRRLVHESYAEYRAALGEIVAEGIARGEFRPVPVAQTAVALTALFEGVTLMRVVDPDAMELERDADFSFRLILDGLRAPAAHREVAPD